MQGGQRLGSQPASLSYRVATNPPMALFDPIEEPLDYAGFEDLNENSPTASLYMSAAG